MKIFLLSFLFLTISMFSNAQQIVKLYSGDALGLKKSNILKEIDSQKNKNDIMLLQYVSVPTLEIIKPKIKKSETAVIICPGGGYGILAYDHEGTTIGKWFADKGITAFVLKYRLPEDDMFDNPEIRPLQDAQQALRHIRSNSKTYGVDPNKIGIMGFSAGGHLAATASTHFKTQVGEIIDDKISVRPDFSILMYPVISFSDKIGHTGSRDNLLGKNAPFDKIEYYSNELQVTKETPPAFLVHAINDWVMVENSLAYVKACKAAGVPAELHMYDKGGHGFGMKKGLKGPVSHWPERLEEWLIENKWL